MADTPTTKPKSRAPSPGGYVVESLARSYRPRRFRDLVGQEEIVGRLRGALKLKKVPGFLLFYGPSGCGKTTLARLLARYLNCEKGTACGKCSSCMHDPDNHPDIIELNAADNRGIDDIRALTLKARLMPRYNVRMIILDEAHQLTSQASNAFLKPLEDTPASTVYVICTTDPDKLPTAMITRASQYAVRMPKPEELRERLTAVAEAEGMKVKTDLLDGIIEYSGGYVRTALNLLEAAAQLKAYDPTLDSKKVLVKIGASASPQDAAIALKIVMSMHKGLAKSLISAIYDVEDAVGVLNLCLRYNEYLLACFAIKGQHPNVWHTADCRAFKTKFDAEVEKFSAGTAVEVERRLSGARTAILTTAGTNSRTVLLTNLIAS